MGCSLSKDIVETPSKGSKGTSSFDKAIHRRFTMQITRSLKAADGGYIAAIFSAYGVVRKHVPFKAWDTKASLQNPSHKVLYSSRTRTVAVGSDSNPHNDSTANTVLGVPTMCTNSASELLEAQKSTKSSMESSETINVLELMDGLEGSPNSDSWLTSLESLSLMTPVHNQEPSLVVSTKPTEKEHIPEALSANKTARRPRPKSFSSFSPIRSIEDVDAALLTRNSRTPLPLQSSRPKSFSVISSIRTSEDVDAALSSLRGNTPPPSKSSRECLEQEEDAHREGCSSIENTSRTILDIDTTAQNGKLDICVPTCKPATSATNGDDASMLKSENLQRALSFKYMFDHSSSEKQNVITNALSTKMGEPNPSICRSDSLVFPTASLLYDSEGNSSPSSPHLSPFSTRLSKTSDDLTVGGYETSMSEALQSQCEDDPPVFDPEMVDFFENAMRCLSKEEWYALRGMEDSPRNFQRLINLKKSNSSLCNQKGRGSSLQFSTTMKANNKAGIDTKDRLESESKSERLPVEKKWAFMRQNSLGIRKTLSKMRAEDVKDDRASVVFYSSTIRDGSNAHEDCNRVRSILQSLVGSSYDERSISELEEHEQELRHVLNISVSIVPTLYFQGTYLVGIESILHLYKKGRLGFMLKDAGRWIKGYHAV